MPINEKTYLDLVAAFSGSDIVAAIPDALVPLWCDDYYRHFPQAELTQVDINESASCFSYIFDLASESERPIVSFGIPTFCKHKRDASRMAGHPLGAGPGFHRGHLMAHSIGGGADINLVPQLGKLNIGAFRALERLVRDLAENNLRCLYFVRPIYTGTTQIPTKFEQCAILPSRKIHYLLHTNA